MPDAQTFIWHVAILLLNSAWAERIPSICTYQLNCYKIEAFSSEPSRQFLDRLCQSSFSIHMALVNDCIEALSKAIASRWGGREDYGCCALRTARQVQKESDWTRRGDRSGGAIVFNFSPSNGPVISSWWRLERPLFAGEPSPAKQLCYLSSFWYFGVAADE